MPGRVAKAISITSQARRKNAEAVKLLVNEHNKNVVTAITNTIARASVSNAQKDDETPPKWTCLDCGSYRIMIIRESVPVESNIPSSLFFTFISVFIFRWIYLKLCYLYHLLNY